MILDKIKPPPDAPIGIKVIHFLYAIAILGYVFSWVLSLSGVIEKPQMTFLNQVRPICAVALWVLVVISIQKRMSWGAYIIAVSVTYDLISSYVPAFCPGDIVADKFWHYANVPIAILILVYAICRRSYFQERIKDAT